MRVLINEPEEYSIVMESIEIKKIDCWNWKAPCTFAKMPKEFTGW